MPSSSTAADVSPVRRAVLSVSDKRDLVELAQALAAAGVHLLASGGTRAALAAAGLNVTEVADYTGQAEILGGRVKTLHPKIHGGILARRDLPADLETLAAHGIDLIDLVVVNLYPFESTIADPSATMDDAIENIDIGGPSLIRAAAKNHEHVAVLTDPSQYESFLGEFRTTGGTTRETRRRLAREAFKLTGRYDRAIAEYLERLDQGDDERANSLSRGAKAELHCFGKPCGMERIPTSRRRSTSSPGPREPAWPRPPSCMARSSRTTTCSIWTAPCG